MACVLITLIAVGGPVACYIVYRKTGGGAS